MSNKQLTLGSLFSGSGGFELAGIYAGIKPIWLSEIEPYAVLVTHNRLLGVRHYGDVSKLSGADLPPVDIITFGSPCQDMSIAGKRSGLDGERSGLFHQAIRIIKEMRDATNGKYPRYILWENVEGCLSSNNGEDFRTVLQEISSIKANAVSVPRPDKKWCRGGVIMGDNYSIAWRLLDAQFFGVAQRRRRVFLVGDLDGRSAASVLSDESRLCGDFAESFRAGQGTAGGAAESTGTTGADRYCINTQGQSGVSVTVDHAGTLVAQDHGNHPAVLEAAGFCTEHSAQARGIGYEEEKAPTLCAGVVPAALLFENHSADTRYRGPLDVSPTISATLGMGGNNQPFVVHPPKAYGICAKHSNSMQSDNPHSGFYEADTARTIDTSDQSPVKNQGGMCVVAFEPGAASRVGGHIYSDGKSGTLRANAGDNQQAVVAPETYDVRFTSSGTKNARGHCYKTEICRCLDTGGQDPESNHGGIAVVNDTTETYALQGSMIGRSERNGPQGSGVNKDVCFTLNTADRHCIAAPEGSHYSTSKNSHHTVAAREQANTLVASDWKDPPLVNDTPNDEPVYIVRRLTPTECARLQGLPDWWCKSLDNQNPTAGDIAFWQDVWNEWSDLNGKKRKSESQIRKWLADPYSDSAEYKLYGNGIAVPCGYFVLSGIAWAAQNSEAHAANCERTDTM